MKLLLNESLPKDLRQHLPGHQVSTVPERGCASKSNGELLRLASGCWRFGDYLEASMRTRSRLTVSGITLLILMAAFAPMGTRADSDRRDGNWWRSLSPDQKAHYAVGFFDGTQLGRDFSVWQNPADKETLAKASDSFNEYFDRYMKNVNSSQMTDGLDSLYTDFRNRSIVIDRAVWLVLSQIAGDPDAQKRIETHRRNAGAF
jgi:hypothetical protein